MVGDEKLPFSDSKMGPAYLTDFLGFPKIKFELLVLFCWKALCETPGRVITGLVGSLLPTKSRLFDISTFCLSKVFTRFSRNRLFCLSDTNSLYTFSMFFGLLKSTV